MEIEIWKPIEGFENYEVSNLGNVRNIKKNKQLKKQLSKYYHVNLYDTYGKAYKKLIHRLVAIAFIPNPNNLPIVNHIDENKLNNCVKNLEWCSIKENVIHSSRPHPNDDRYKQASKKILQYSLLGEFIKEWKSVSEASNYLGITASSISSCLKNKVKTSGGFQWKYYEENYKIQINSSISKNSGKRPINQYDLDGNFLKTWKSSKEIALSLKINTPKKIIDCCKGKLKDYKGYIWRYYSKDFSNKISVEHYKILQFDLNKNFINEYNNVVEALKSVNGKSEGMILNCCEKTREKAYGYIWEYKKF